MLQVKYHYVEIPLAFLLTDKVFLKNEKYILVKHLVVCSLNFESKTRTVSNIFETKSYV